MPETIEFRARLRMIRAELRELRKRDVVPITVVAKLQARLERAIGLLWQVRERERPLAWAFAAVAAADSALALIKLRGGR
jgi:hypothetical protein